MIETLNELPKLTESWLAPLKEADPELYGELAGSLVVHPADCPNTSGFPAGMAEALSLVDLCGKEIGSFRFAPVDGTTALEQIVAYDRLIRQDYEVDSGIIFVGEYGPCNIFVSPQGVGLLDPISNPPRILALAKSFDAFLVAQANAYDAYKRFIVKSDDRDAFRASAVQCSALPGLKETDVLAIFEAQRTA